MSTASVEDRRQTGSFYTPRALVDFLVTSCVPRHGRPRVLDPSCGDGAFLAGIERWNPSARLLGLDLDSNALRAARAHHPGADLQCVDALSERTRLRPGTLDVVVGNPPYVRSRRLPEATRAELKRRYSWVHGQFDLTVPFVQQSLRWLRPGGRLGFVLPNKVLVASYAKRMREALVTSHRLVQVIDLSAEEEAFGGACAYPVLVIVERGPTQPGDTVLLAAASLVRGRVVVTASRDVLVKDWHPGAPARLDSAAEQVWARTDLPSFGSIARAREAVHTGNIRARLVHDRPVDPSCQRLLRGRDVQRWRLHWAGRWLREGVAIDRAAGEYANVPPPSLFEGPKVLLREIAAAPTAAYDPDGHRCLNKAYVVRPLQRPTPERLLSLCAVLNSTPFERLFRARYSASGLRGGHLQFKPQWVSTVPVPPLDAVVAAGVPDLARQRLGGNEPGLDRAIDQQIEALYGWAQ